MTSDKKNISLLANLFLKSGLKNIIISPGSRNAPIIISFANKPGITAYSIVDERSAAYMALGMSLQTKKTTAIACTSGTSVLNYAPAIAEAYYQKVPLLVITADRPSHLIHVGDGQTIKQKNVFSNYIKKSFELPLEISSENDFKLAEKMINEALMDCIHPEPGPVHINIPFDEPLYGTAKLQDEGTLVPYTENNNYNTVEIDNLADLINRSKKVMIIAGQNSPNPELSMTLNNYSLNKNIVVLSETTSNLNGNLFIDTIDNVISSIASEESEQFQPDILITFGGQVVSKMVKRYLRRFKPNQHIHISNSGEKLDTYLCLTKTITSKPLDVFEKASSIITPRDEEYINTWYSRKKECEKKRLQYLSQIKFCDLMVFNEILNYIPDDSVLHLGNSTPVRYSQLFGSNRNINYQSNRGVSGIDGQISTALGYSQNSDKLNILVTGDLGFHYDSNGLMNQYFPPNLKIIVINNQGGGIFRFIPGPDTTPNLEKFFVAQHNWSAEYICKAYNIDYQKCKNNDNISIIIADFINDKSTAVLEIFTPKDANSKVLRDYFSFLKS